MSIKKEKKPQTGRGVTYIVRTFSLSPHANKLFEDCYDGLDKYAIKNQLRRPAKGDVLGKMVEKSGKLTPEEWFK